MKGERLRLFPERQKFQIPESALAPFAHIRRRSNGQDRVLGRPSLDRGSGVARGDREPQPGQDRVQGGLLPRAPRRGQCQGLEHRLGDQDVDAQGRHALQLGAVLLRHGTVGLRKVSLTIYLAFCYPINNTNRLILHFHS